MSHFFIQVFLIILPKYNLQFFQQGQYITVLGYVCYKSVHWVKHFVDRQINTNFKDLANAILDIKACFTPSKLSDRFPFLSTLARGSTQELA